MGFKIDLMEDKRLEESGSISAVVEEKERFLDGDRKDAGDNDDCLPAKPVIDVIGASRFSSDRFGKECC